MDPCVTAVEVIKMLLAMVTMIVFGVVGWLWMEGIQAIHPADPTVNPLYEACGISLSYSFWRIVIPLLGLGFFSDGLIGFVVLGTSGAILVNSWICYHKDTTGKGKYTLWLFWHLSILPVRCGDRPCHRPSNCQNELVSLNISLLRVA